MTFVHASGNEVALVKVKNKKAEITDKLPFVQDQLFLFERSLTNRSSFTILSVMKGVHYLVSKEGKFAKRLSQADFDVFDDKKISSFNRMSYSYHKDGKAVFNVVEKPKLYFEFDKSNLRFKEINGFDYRTGRNIHWSGTNNKYLLTYEQKEENSLFSIYNPSDNYSLNETFTTDDFHMIAYRDLNKEVILLYENTVERVLFNQNAIKTYLKGESIRAMLEIGDGKYIISTDTKGIYELDTNSGRTTKIRFTQNGAEKSITMPREIIKTNSGYIFNDISRLYFVNTKYEIQNVYEHDMWREETIQVGDTIFRGGVHHLGVKKFSISGRNYTNLKGYNYQTREFATNGTDLYVITIKDGLVLYKNGLLTNYLPRDEKGQNLLSIYYHPDFKVLVTTKQGKIYQFDPDSRSFSVFYEDPLKASIVGVIVDDSNNIWLNTYAGIVSLNLKTKKTKRYTKKDGIYELEGNRYSTYKDSKGNLLFGSFKGLSVFNPNELSTLNSDMKLKFSELSFYNKTNEKWTTHQDLDFLNSTKEIILPSFNQRFSARIGLENIVNHKNYKYGYRLVQDSEKELPEWSPLYLDNEIVFSNLSAGEYTLQVEVLSSINKKLGDVLELKIISRKIFYKTWWFALILLSMIVVVFSYLFYQFKSKQKLFAENQIALNEAKVKEAMMLEIHHRIKNNLQVVSGLLSIQAFNTQNDELKAKLQDSQGRIESIAGIHNILYKSDSQEKVLVEEYFSDIISYNKTLFTKSVKYNLDIDEFKMPMDKAIPLALIFNELINNSHKHAFKENENPEIKVSFKKEYNVYRFIYADNGKFKEGEGNNTSMGMKIINMMISQLKGEVEMNTKNNFEIIINFPFDNFG